jgi:hypothetical protein
MGEDQNSLTYDGQTSDSVCTIWVLYLTDYHDLEQHHQQQYYVPVPYQYALSSYHHSKNLHSQSKQVRNN